MVDINQMLENDPRLRDEVQKKFGKKTTAAAAEGTPGPNAERMESLGLGGEGMPMGMEAIILSYGRPVLFVRKNTFEIPMSDVWTERLRAAQGFLDKIIPAVGRIEVKNHDELDWVGTGWLVRDDVVVTNRHVAVEFGLKAGQLPGFIFKKNLSGRTIKPSIDFREEYNEPEEDELMVKEVLYISDDFGPDVAFLRLEKKAERPPIELDPAPQKDSDVAVIGYPARDGRRNPGPDMARIYGDVYDVKRLAPGSLTKVDEQYVYHDCTTLGGNSGSAVIDLKTGRALGLHFSGSFKKTNYAVPAPVVKQLLDQIP
ncbi:MAG TPA: serine protease [Thermoanaerobaculia bacterium]|nr:serine protease [Thermoanaerobaculia bacterium]